MTLIRQSFFLRIFVSALCCLLISGCASKVVKEDQYSGYLKDYSKLERVETATGDETLRWISKKISNESYHSVLIEKTVFYPKPTANEQVSENLLQQLSSSVDVALDSSARGVYKVVKDPGPGVLTIKPAITGVAHSMEGIQPVEILPIALVIGIGKAVAGSRDRDVEVFLEVSVEDSLSGELLAAAVRKGEGEQLDDDEEQLNMTHLNEMVKNWQKDATEVFRQLAK